MNTSENTFTEKKKKETMRRLDLKNYTLSIPNTQGVMQFETYQFKKVLMQILTNVNLGLTGPELLEADRVTEQIEKADKEILLTEEDYQLIVETFKLFRGFSKNDVRMVKRIWDCPTVEAK